MPGARRAIPKIRHGLIGQLWRTFSASKLDILSQLAWNFKRRHCRNIATDSLSLASHLVSFSCWQPFSSSAAPLYPTYAKKKPRAAAVMCEVHFRRLRAVCHEVHMRDAASRDAWCSASDVPPHAASGAIAPLLHCNHAPLRSQCKCTSRHFASITN